jgi:hypothetical protein
MTLSIGVDDQLVAVEDQGLAEQPIDGGAEDRLGQPGPPERHLPRHGGPAEDRVSGQDLVEQPRVAAPRRRVARRRIRYVLL